MKALSKIIAYTIVIFVGLVIIFAIFGNFFPGLREKTEGLRKYFFNYSIGAEELVAEKEEIPADGHYAFTILCNAFRTYERAADHTCIVKYPDLPPIPDGYVLYVDSLDPKDEAKRKIRISLARTDTGRILETCYVRNLYACYVIPRNFVARDYENSYYGVPNFMIRKDDGALTDLGEFSIDDEDARYNYLFKLPSRRICFFITHNGAVNGPIYNENFAFDDDAIGGGEGLFDVKWTLGFPRNGISLLEELPICREEPVYGTERYVKAMEFYNKGYYSSAITFFIEIMMYYEDHLSPGAFEEVSFLIGLSYYKTGDLDKAKNYFSLFKQPGRYPLSEYRYLSEIYYNLSDSGIAKDEGCALMHPAYYVFGQTIANIEGRIAPYGDLTYYNGLSKLKSIIDNYPDSACIELAKKEIKRFCIVGQTEPAARELCVEIEKNTEKYYPEVEA